LAQSQTACRVKLWVAGEQNNLVVCIGLADLRCVGTTKKWVDALSARFLQTVFSISHLQRRSGIRLIPNAALANLEILRSRRTAAKSRN